jgi:hypothetical protein
VRVRRPLAVVVVILAVLVMMIVRVVMRVRMIPGVAMIVIVVMPLDSGLAFTTSAYGTHSHFPRKSE